MIPLDLAFVIVVIALAIILHPDTEATLHRLELAWRLWRNGCSSSPRAAWYMAERR